MTALLSDLLPRLYTLSRKEMNRGLDRLSALLDKVGNPHLRLPPTIHVAGTNGKGSTIAFMRSILEASGRKVHVYTSPHLVKFNERICLAGHYAEDEALAEVLLWVLDKNDNQPITFFEIVTIAAFLLFSKTPADVLLLETGVGGRLDVTNIIPPPLAAVITPISYDHQECLGTSLTQIAFEKAGIIKKGSPVVVAKQPEEAERVFITQAALQGVSLHLYGKDWDESLLKNYPAPNLVGAHQVLNAATAVKTLQVQTAFPVLEKDINQGVSNVHWPGRLQCLYKGEYEVWLDGAHNQAGAEALSQELHKWSQKGSVFGIIGMKADKNAMHFLQVLKPYMKKAYMVPIGEDKSGFFSGEDLVSITHSINFPAQVSDNYQAALEEIKQSEKIPYYIIITGSLFLIGEVLKKQELTCY